MLSLDSRPLLGTLLIPVVFAIGCAQQNPAVNPFIAADRVPPPMSQLQQPPMAQPYYQGAPPVQNFQGAPPQTFQAPAPMPQGSGTRFAPGASLQQPGAAAFASAQPMAPPAAATPGPPIAIPTDDRALRFAQAAPQPPQFAASQVAPAAYQQPVAPQPPFQQQPVQQPTLPMFAEPHATTDGLPWNSGSAPRAIPAAAMQHAQPMPAAPAPRVRLPGQPVTGRVQITELPPQSYSPPAGMVPAGDGFQARR